MFHWYFWIIWCYMCISYKPWGIGCWKSKYLYTHIYLKFPAFRLWLKKKYKRKQNTSRSWSLLPWTADNANQLSRRPNPPQQLCKAHHQALATTTVHQVWNYLLIGWREDVGCTNINPNLHDPVNFVSFGSMRYLLLTSM